jgi:hypothetical protein
MQRFDEVTTAAPKDEQSPAIGIKRQHRVRHRGQPIEALAHIGDLAGQIHPRRRWQHHGAARAASTRCSAAPSTSVPTPSRTPVGSSNSINPSTGACANLVDGGSPCSSSEPAAALSSIWNAVGVRHRLQPRQIPPWPLAASACAKCREAPFQCDAGRQQAERPRLAQVFHARSPACRQHSSVAVVQGRTRTSTRSGETLLRASYGASSDSATPNPTTQTRRSRHS